LNRRARRTGGTGPERRPPNPVELELSIPSDVSYIEWVVSKVTQECVTHAFSPRHCRLNVPVALTEALSNAILRGNGGNVEKLVLTHASVDDSSLIIEVSDEGGGFDMGACTVDPERASLEREDGRGLFLMQALMDRVEQFTIAGRNVVRLTLKRP
jgi:serine/threonine-protein kinase RsbW